jgi:hypothetical protein
MVWVLRKKVVKNIKQNSLKTNKKRVEPTAPKSGVMSNKSGQTPPKENKLIKQNTMKKSPAKQKAGLGGIKVKVKATVTPKTTVAPKAGIAGANAPTKMKDVSKKTAYNIKEASNQKLTATARKHYAENAQAAMKNKKKK